MRIFLIYPLIGFDPSYNCGLGYIASVLKADGHEVDYLRIRTQSEVDDLYKRIETEKPALIAFSSTSCQFNHLRQIIPAIRSRSKAFLVCGGVHPTVKPDCILEISELDAIVRGEGEFPMKELACALESRTDHLGIHNFWFRNNGDIIQNPLRPLVDDLDALPFPFRDTRDYQDLLDNSRGIHRMIFSRGCTFGCPYCSNKALREVYKDKGSYYRLRSPRKAIEEIERDEKQFRFNFIFFDDDTITLNRKWFFEFFEMYKERFDYPFCCNLRPGIVTDEMVKLLKEAGAGAVAVGVEHGNENLRKTVLKREITNAEITETIRLCQRHGIEEIFAQIMIGLPFETVSLYLDTVRLCRELGVVPFKYIYQPYPGTELGNLCEQNNWIPNEELFLERHEAVIDFPGFCRKDIQLCFDVFSSLVRHKSWPLRVPLVPTVKLLRFYRFAEDHLLPKIRPVRQSLRSLRQQIWAEANA